jgi:hypothetical protein
VAGDFGALAGSPCTLLRPWRPGNGMRAFDSGAGENVMEWYLNSSSLVQKSSIKV